MYLKLDYVRISYYIGEVGYTNNLSWSNICMKLLNSSIIIEYLIRKFRIYNRSIKYLINVYN